MIADFMTLITALSPLLHDKAASIASVAWRATVGGAVPRPGHPDRSARVAVESGVKAARAECGGRLPRGVGAVLSAHLAPLAQHTVAVHAERWGRPEDPLEKRTGGIEPQRLEVLRHRLPWFRTMEWACRERGIDPGDPAKEGNFNRVMREGDDV